MVISKRRLNKKLEAKSAQCHSVHHKHHINWVAIETRVLRYNMPPIARLCGLLSVKTGSVYAYISLCLNPYPANVENMVSS
jgi:hypothetical protein